MTARVYADPNNPHIPKGLSIVPARWSLEVGRSEPGTVDAGVRVYGVTITTARPDDLPFSPGTLVHKWQSFALAIHVGSRSLIIARNRERFAL